MEAINQSINNENKKSLSKFYEILKIVNREAININAKAYIVGGFVRDTLLNMETTDLDIVVLGDGKKLAEILNKKLEGRLTINERFLTGTILLDSGINIDIVTARKEEYSGVGKLPIVTPSTIKEDLLRRDFTINTFLIDLHYFEDFDIIDMLNVISDLYQKQIRVIHSKSFYDDPTRIYRAIRFAFKLNFNIEEKTMKLINEAIKEKALNFVSKDRLFNEVYFTLFEIKADEIIAYLNEKKLLTFIRERNFISKNTILQIREIEYLNDSEKALFNLDMHSRVFLKITLLFQKLSYNELVEFLMELSISRKLKDKLLSIKKNQKRILSVLLSLRITDYMIYKALCRIDNEVLIYYIISTSNITVKTRIYRYMNFLSKIEIHVKGEDISNQGIKQGPVYTDILDRAHEEIINKNIFNQEEQLEVLIKICKEYKGVE